MPGTLSTIPGSSIRWTDSQLRWASQYFHHPEDNVLKVAQFLGVKLTAEELRDVVSQTSFSTMSEKVDTYQPVGVGWKPGYRFIRNEKKGDDSLFVADGSGLAKR